MGATNAYQPAGSSPISSIPTSPGPTSWARAPRSSPQARVGPALATSFIRRVGSLKTGRLELTLPDRTRHILGDPTSKRVARLEIHDWGFFTRALLSADIGIGESYMAGEWSSPDLVELCEMFAQSPDALEQNGLWRLPADLVHQALSTIRANTKAGSRKNISEHYDLGNDFYKIFLDETMMYSSAVYSDPGLTLKEAQVAKLEGICERLDLGVDDHVLEIGSGWGAFAIHAARTRGCRVTSITLSVEQRTMAMERAEAAKVSHLVVFRLCDYRDVAGQYDAIVSIEMIEAVGHKYLPTFFRTLEDRLAPHGRVFLQGITVPDQHYDRYRKSFDWIRKYIFPGGCLLSVSAIAGAVRDNTNLRIDWMKDIGPDYARTLEEWRSRFQQGLPRVKALGFDARFVRMWDLYLASCEAGFATGQTGNLQLVLSRATPCRKPGS